MAEENKDNVCDDRHHYDADDDEDEDDDTDVDDIKVITRDKDKISRTVQKQNMIQEFPGGSSEAEQCNYKTATKQETKQLTVYSKSELFKPQIVFEQGQV